MARLFDIGTKPDGAAFLMMPDPGYKPVKPFYRRATREEMEARKRNRKMRRAEKANRTTHV